IIVTRTFSVPKAKAGVHTVVALTGENPALRQGWASVAVSIGFDESGHPVIVGAVGRPLVTPPPAVVSPTICRVRTSPKMAEWLTGDHAPHFSLGGHEVKFTQSDALPDASGEEPPSASIAT